MRIVIRPDYRAVCRWAANHIVSRLREASGRGRPFVLGLPTGSTPLGVYRELIARHEAGTVSFADVVSFNMDEYVGLPVGHPQSYRHFMEDNFFSRVDIRRENAHLLDGCAADLAAECAAYERAMEAAGGIDLFLGGVGADAQRLDRAHLPRAGRTGSRSPSFHRCGSLGVMRRCGPGRGRRHRRR